MDLGDSKNRLGLNLGNGWRDIVTRYQAPTLSKSAWQLINSITPYIGLWGLMWWSLKVSYLLTLALSILA